MKKRILSLFLCLVLCLTLIPATAVLAADGDSNVKLYVQNPSSAQTEHFVVAGKSFTVRAVATGLESGVYLNDSDIEWTLSEHHSGTTLELADAAQVTRNLHVDENETATTITITATLKSDPTIFSSYYVNVQPKPKYVSEIDLTYNSTLINKDSTYSEATQAVADDYKVTGGDGAIKGYVSNANCSMYQLNDSSKWPIKNDADLASYCTFVGTSTDTISADKDLIYVFQIQAAPDTQNIRPAIPKYDFDEDNLSEITVKINGSVQEDAVVRKYNDAWRSVKLFLRIPAADIADTYAPEVYNVSINDEHFTSDKLTITCGTGTATYNPDTSVLTLNNAQITGTGSGNGITSNESITISLIGENTIANFADGIYGYVKGDEVNLRSDTLSLVGTGKLTMTNVLGGIRNIRGGLAITDSVTVEIDSTKPSAPAAGLYVQSGALTIDSDSTVNITAAYTAAHVGYNVKIADNASVNITAANYGIESMSGIEFSDNVTVTIKSGSHGVYTYPYGKVKISGGTITIDVELENKTAIKAKDGIVVDPKCEMVTPENGEITAMTDGDHAGSTIILDGEALANHAVFALKCTHANTEIRNVVEATCTEEGYTGDTYCKDCDKLLDEGSVVEMKDHDYNFDIYTPTCTEDGYQIITCSSCDYELKVSAGAAYGHHDEDLDGKCDICGADISVEYEMISGDGSEWTKGSEETLVFVSDAEFALFDSVMVDGEAVADTDYIAMTGSTKIVLNAEYLETLAPGEHTIEIVSTNGSASGTFVVKAAQATNPTDDPAGPTDKPADPADKPADPSDKPVVPTDKPADSNNTKPVDKATDSDANPAAPKTGDNTSLIALLGLAMLSAGALVFAANKKKENK